MNYKEFTKTYSLTLSRQQADAVQAVNGHVLLLAVPGSGKTTVLVARLGYMLLCCGIQPSEILTMTYTVAATKDMKERFCSMFGDELSRNVEFRTINGVSAKIIQRYERMTGRQAFSLETSEKRLAAIVSEIYRRIRNDYLPDGEIKNIMSKIGYVKNMLLSGEQIKEIDKEIKDFSKIYAEYVRIMKERQLMDYDDQMVYAYTILRKYPEILKFYTDRIQYVCVDEAQDTSKVQHMIIDLLSSGSGNLFMVGDEDQSIYGFRAAYPEALTGFGSKYPDARILLMEQNYRSTDEIVSAADKFIKANTSRHDKNMRSYRGAGHNIKEISLRSRKNQYSYLMQVIRECDQETAVLYRDNSSALPLIDLLNRNDIGYRCRQMDINFFTNRVVKDITDIIRFAYDRSNAELFSQIYYKLNARINKTAAVYAIYHCRNGRSLLDYLSSDMSLSQWVRSQCTALETHMNNLMRENGGKAVYRIVNFMGYGEYLENRKLGTTEADVLKYIGDNEPTPKRLLERLGELQEIALQGTTDPDSNIILSTIHSSKGLEFDRVILMDVIDSILPCCSPSETKEYEEERRLFYVAMTRAKNELAVFTFEDRMYRSSFSDTIFSKHKTADIHKIKVNPLIPVKNSSTALLDKINVGTRVHQTVHGNGTVISKENGYVIIDFDNGRCVKFNLLQAMKPNIKIIK